jgi:hypothetical protein
MNNLKLVDASLDGTVTYSLYISPNFSNLNGAPTLEILTSDTS